MAAKISSVLVVGLGKVGSLVGVLLQESGFKVAGMDSAKRSLSYETLVGDVTNAAALAKALKGKHAVVSCLPYNLNLGVAKAAFVAGVHYFDLTEDVPTTKAVLAMSKKAKTVMAPQCGLAPGFIGIVGASLARRFDKLRSIELRVGALPQHPRGLMGYAFNWSSEGVVNEYLNDCEVIKDGVAALVPAMEGLETIFIDGMALEAFTTSGGLGTMCETYAGKVDALNYKTMRYPGHCDLMRFFFQELHMKNNRKLAGEILVNAKPPVDEDVVYVHAAVEGWKKGKLAREEFVRAYEPLTIAGEGWRAISWTTAASVVSVVEMVRDGTLPSKGFIKQEDISLDHFLRTHGGQLYVRGEKNRGSAKAAPAKGRNLARVA
jgi:saccharopine dehydrogenase-like NADP-dependent oxidoreductase